MTRALMLQSAPARPAGDAEGLLTGRPPADTTSPDTAVPGHRPAAPVPGHHCAAPGPAPGPDSYRPAASLHSSPSHPLAFPECHRRIRDHSTLAGPVAAPGVTTDSRPQPAHAPVPAVHLGHTAPHSRYEKLHAAARQCRGCHHPE